MTKSEPQYAYYTIQSGSEPDADGHLATSLISTSLPIPTWLCGNTTISGGGLFVIYYSVVFYTCASCALYQNEIEIPATRIRGNQNHGYIILSTEGRMKTHIHLRASQTTIKRGSLLIANLSFLDEKSVIE